MNNMNDNRSKAGLVERYIGTAYDKVALVADNIELIIHAADHVLTHHNLLMDRHEIDSHPQEAITGLVQELMDMKIEIGSAISSVELAEVWAAVHLRATTERVQILNDIVDTKASVESVQGKAGQVEFDALEVVVSGKAALAELAILYNVVLTKADKTELVSIHDSLANKADLSNFDDHTNDLAVHTPVGQLVRQIEKGQPHGVAPLDGNNHIPASHLPSIPHISHVYSLVVDMLTAGATPGVIREGEMCFVYGEDQVAQLTDAPAGTSDPAVWLVANPRVRSDKNGEYVAKQNDPTDLAHFYFYGDWVPSHGHTPDECGAAPKSLEATVNAHMAKANAHPVNAHHVDVDDIAGASGAINIGRNVHEALANSYNTGLSLLTQLGIESARISANQHNISVIGNLIESNKIKIDDHIKTANPHNMTWKSLPGVPSTFPPAIHSHSEYEGKNPLIMAHINKTSGNPHGVSWDTLLGKPDISGGSWSSITGKPSTFPPSAHNQSWSTITGKPATYPPGNHQHGSNDISHPGTNGQTTVWAALADLDGRVTRRLFGTTPPAANAGVDGDVYYQY